MCWMISLAACWPPVTELSTALDKLQADTGPDVEIHVDAASGDHGQLCICLP
jgi:hypothetical protein